MRRFNLVLLVILAVFNFDNSFGQIKKARDFRVAQKLYSEELYLPAIDAFIDFQKNYPDDPRAADAQFLIGESHLKRNDHKAAFAAFSEYTAVYYNSPQFGDAWFKRAECKANLGEKEAAAELYLAAARNLFDSDKFAAKALYESAKLFNELKLFSKAKNALSSLADNYGSHELYYPGVMLFAEILAKENNYILALKNLERIKTTNASPEFKWEAAYHKSKIYLKLKNTYSADEELSYILNNAGKDLDVYAKATVNKAALNILANKPQDNEALLTPLLSSTFEKSDDGWLLLELFGESRLLTGENAQAVTVLSDALKANPESRRTAFLLGKALHANGNAQEAFLTLNKLYTGNWVERLGEWSDKIADNTLGYEPGNEGGYENEIFELYLTTAKETNNVIDTAVLSSGMNGLAGVFRSPISFEKLSGVLIANGLFDAAENLLESGISKFTGERGEDLIRLNLGVLNEAMGKTSRSTDIYKYIIQNYPGGDISRKAERNLKYLTLKNASVFRNSEYYFSELNSISTISAELSAGVEAYNNRNLTAAKEIFEQQINSGAQAQSISNEFLAKTHSETAFIYEFEGDLRSANSEKQTALKYHIDNYNNAAGQMKKSSGLAYIIDNSISNLASPTEKLNSGINLLNVYAANDREMADIYNLKLAELNFLYNSNADTAKAHLNALSKMNSGNYAEDIAENVFYNAVKRAVDLEDFAAGYKLANKYVTDFPTGRNSAEVTLLGAKALYASHDYVKAKLWSEKLLNKYYYSKHAVPAGAILGDVYVYAGRYDEAETEFVRAYAIMISMDYEKNVGEIYRRLGNVYDGKKDYYNAEMYYNLYHNFADTALERIKAKNLLAKIHEKTGQLKQAIEAYTSIQGEAPGTPEAFQAKTDEARLLLESVMDYPAAQLKYQELMTADVSDSAKAFYEYSYLTSLYRRDRRAQANRERDGFDKRYKSLPKERVEKYTGLLRAEEGYVHARNRKPDDAENIFNDLISKYPGTEVQQVAELYMGVLKLGNNLIEEGLPLLREFDKRYPYSPYLYQVYRYLGNFQYGAEQYPDAYLSFSKSIKTTEGKADTLVHRRYIQSAFMSGFEAVELDAINAYLTQFPRAGDRFSMRKRIGQIYKSQGRTDEALAYLRGLINEASLNDEVEIQFDIAEILKERGEYARAIVEYIKIIAYGKNDDPGLPYNITAKYSVAECFEKLGNYDKAIKYLDEIIKTGNTDFSRRAARTKERVLQQKK